MERSHESHAGEACSSPLRMKDRGWGALTSSWGEPTPFVLRGSTNEAVPADNSVAHPLCREPGGTCRADRFFWLWGELKADWNNKITKITEWISWGRFLPVKPRHLKAGMWLHVWGSRSYKIIWVRKVLELNHSDLEPQFSIFHVCWHRRLRGNPVAHTLLQETSRFASPNLCFPFSFKNFWSQCHI